ncbi:hypothetical protein HIM_07001 [Hirsutella minnesotensis 3608]|uniref:Carboxylic ester hydrolase n=1 Tax=Hirsutella minnesotensis 3608 TaxID=1043627 RepID=A0A0F7ZTT4_9HYPO|nr:hypothetical protein HIM_07001 [Hirsutella minnesotensis 3608]
MARFLLTVAAALGSAVIGSPVQSHGGDGNPVVDLGYALHRGALNSTGDFYAFRNIRFAEPPVGKRRFQPAEPVSSVNRTVDDGAAGHVCPQGSPEWKLRRDAAMAKTNVSTDTVRMALENDPRQNEDCLFLDVMVPKKIYGKKWEKKSSAGQCHGPERGAPVLVWIYGGGYVFGRKDDAAYDPAGLIARSQQGGSEGIVYVALNYRLGMFGWLNTGGDKRVFPNAALTDQRVGLEWIKKYIHLFGGDPDNVTVFGASAGGGSIMHHITGEGGKKKAPFKRAIVQSPGFQTVVDIPGIWKRILASATKHAGSKIRNGAELAALDSKTLLKINQEVVANSPEGTYTFSPTVDGGYVPDQPGVLLLDGRFDSSPKLMLGHNSHEGLAYILPADKSAAKVQAKLRTLLPGIPKRNMEYIWSELYPPPSDKGVYKTENERGVLLTSEVFFTCNTRYLGTAFGNATWNYRFQVSPGTHGQDVPYTFYPAKSGKIDAKLAKDMQLYFTNFAQFGDPNSGGSVPKWSKYGENAQLTTFGADGVGKDTDDTKNKRCAYWQTGKYRS